MLIFRLAHNLNAKLKAGPLAVHPVSKTQPYADWSARLFLVDRTQYILLSNTKSLYSTVLYGKGIADDRRFIDRALSALREALEDDGQTLVYRRFIAPESVTVRFAGAASRAVTGSMTDLISHAATLLAGGELSPFDVGPRLNDVLLSMLGAGRAKPYGTPREAFASMMAMIGDSDGD